MMRNYAQGNLMITQYPDRGKRVMDRISGRGFYVSPTGERLSIADSIKCHCGPEFTDYVRTYLPEFPYSQFQMANRRIETLWPRRRLELQQQTSNSSEGQQKARVVEWQEWNHGPSNDSTWWRVTIKFPKKRGQYGLGDLVEISGLSSQHNEHVGSVTGYNESTRNYEVSYWEDNQMQMTTCLPENLKHKRTVQLDVKRADVEHGGTLEGNKQFGMMNEIPFVWTDPPEQPLIEGRCTHGAENLQSPQYDEAISEYLGQSFGTKGDENVTSTPVKEFCDTHPALACDGAFCRYLYAYCMEQYGKNEDMRDSMLKDNIRNLLLLAVNLQYRYISQASTTENRARDNQEEYDDDDDHEDATQKRKEKLSQYVRELQVDRGIVKVLKNELHCPCSNVLKRKTRHMERKEKCFGCKNEFERRLLTCSKCKFASYCGRDCQAGNWPDHKKACKDIRKFNSS